MQRTGDTGLAVSAKATVYSVQAHAEAEWRIWTGPAAVACLADTLEQSVASLPGALIITTNASPLSLPRVAPRQFARRYLVIWVANAEMYSVTFDVIDLGRRTGAVRLFFQREGPPGAPDATLERRLVRLLGKRLAAAFA